MPIYEYQCQACEHELEVLRKISDPPLTDCPACGAPELKKKVSAAAFRLKGGGWYETDFKTGDNKKNLHGEGEKKDSGSGDTGKSDAGKSDSGKSEKSDSGSKSKSDSGKSAAAK